MLIYRMLVSCLCICIIGCAGSSASDFDIFQSKINSSLSQSAQQTNAPGALLVIKTADGVVTKSETGFSNIGLRTPMSAEMRFRIGSITKTFIGTATLILVKDGHLSLDDTVESVLPGVYSKGNLITVRQLLDQSSGIPDYVHEDAFAIPYVADFTQEWTNAELIALVDAKPLQDTPGNKGYYSNTNYVLLGMIIEQVSGLSIQDFLSQNIFVPLHMTHTYFPANGDAGINGVYADGYFDFNDDGVFTADEIATDQSPTALWTAGMIVSTVDDLLIWLDELMTGTLLNDALQAERMTFNIVDAAALDAGVTEVKYGLGVASMFGSIGFTGALPGYNTAMYRYNGVDVVAMGNGYHTTINVNLGYQIFEDIKSVIDNM